MWLFKRAMKCLPAATGPFMPGCMDVMLGYDQESPMLRLFYPTNAKKDEKENTKKYVPWLPDDSYLVGISRVLMLHLYIVRLLLWWRGRTYVPVLYGEKIRTNEKLKCIVMSHGLGGSRFLYSNICYELASNGFLVLCLEHKEMSACNTYFYANQEDARNDKRTIIDFRHIALGENHYTERNEQIKFRSKECNKVVQFLEDLNGGNVPYNVVADVPTEHDILFDLNDLVANLDLENLTMMGHSFGGATALNSIANNKKI
ncbi:hypothetical protein NQ317_005635 [Molorchus minor]|uniref:1-alkyl-2-acetylglycerophosphocholine esterase n=1 Tax=Molorchus minor TaxID=1323400 RepID=A0ABQ9K6B5_9CUCU|nr:hypothetical protein NQ317_005635 [Molorchus minor]